MPVGEGFSGRVILSGERATFKKFTFAGSAGDKVTMTSFHIHAVKCGFINIGTAPLLHVAIRAEMGAGCAVVTVEEVVLVNPGEAVADEHVAALHGHAIVAPAGEVGQSLHVYNYGLATQEQGSNMVVFEQNQETRAFGRLARAAFEAGSLEGLAGARLRLRWSPGSG
jgi:hypothetical protein